MGSQTATHLEGGFPASPADTTTLPSSPYQNGTHHIVSASPIEQGLPVQTQTTPPAPNSLNPRSCVTCRKRKVRCDKRHPCSNCNKAAIECIFPGPGRAPRRSRKPPETELLARLRKLEGVVQSLGKTAEDGSENLNNGKVAHSVDGKASEDDESCLREADVTDGGMIGAFEPPKKDSKRDERRQSGLVNKFGHLVVDEGRSRYVSNNFWTSLSEEVAEMQDILDDPTDEEDDYPSPDSGSSTSANHQGFIFSFSSTLLSLAKFHPPPEQIPTYWNIYKDNVDPVCKLMHIPTLEKTVLRAAQELNHIGKALEALIFSIYYASVTSLSPGDCLVVLGVEKEATLRKYRFAVEQAFSRANFLSTQELIVLQALLLFLTCVRRTDDSRYVWTITGLLIRLAQALGIHRDGIHFNLSPYETELRRRLWWHICALDVRASEDQGCDPTIVEQSFDTNFPLNINDTDISPSMKEPPEEREGASEMTFDLIRFSVSTAVRRLSYVPPGYGMCRIKSAKMTLKDKEKMIEDLHQHIEKKYLQHCDTKNVPLHWVAATVARLVMAKMWLVVHHPFQRSDAGAGLPQETKDRLFNTSIEVVEFARLLETEKTTLKWGWLFRTYIQWHALAFVLSQLCTRTWGPNVDRAWCVIDGVFDDWGHHLSGNQRGMLWKPLRKLMAKAKTERAKALQKRAMFPLDGSIGPIVSLNTQPGPDMNGSAANLPAYTTNPEATLSNLGDFDDTERTINSLSSADINAPLGQDGPIGQGHLANGINQWNSDPSLFTQETPMILDDSVAWTGWDDMVKDFDMNLNGVDTKGTVFGGQGLTNWL